MVEFGGAYINGLYQWAILKEIKFLTLIYICEDNSLNNSPI